jgi:CRISPR-associated protein Csx17
VLIWRSRTAVSEADQEVTFRGVPTFRSGIRVPAADLHRLAAGQFDADALDMWLRACLALDWQGVPGRQGWGVTGTVVPVPTVGLLHPLAEGVASSADEPRFALRPDWAVRLAAGQVASVHGEAVARLRRTGWAAVPFPPGGARLNGPEVAAALVPRCYGDRAVLRNLAYQINKPSDSEEES